MRTQQKVNPEPSPFSHLTNSDISRSFGFGSLPVSTSNLEFSRDAVVFKEAEGILTYARGCQLPWLHELGDDVPVDEEGEETDEYFFQPFSRYDCIMNPSVALTRNAGFCRIVLCIEEARQLGIDDPMGPEEICAYVRVSLDDVKLFESKVIPRCSSPMWECVLALQVHRPSSVIHIEVYDYDPEVEGHDFLLGHVGIPVSTLKRSATEEAWLTLDPSQAALSLLPHNSNPSFYRAGAVRVAAHVDLSDGFLTELAAHGLPSRKQLLAPPSETRQQRDVDIGRLYATLRTAGLIWWLGVLQPLHEGLQHVLKWKTPMISAGVYMGALAFIYFPMYRLAIMLTLIIAVSFHFPQGSSLLTPELKQLFRHSSTSTSGNTSSLLGNLSLGIISSSNSMDKLDSISTGISSSSSNVSNIISVGNSINGNGNSNTIVPSTGNNGLSTTNNTFSGASLANGIKSSNVINSRSKTASKKLGVTEMAFHIRNRQQQQQQLQQQQSLVNTNYQSVLQHQTNLTSSTSPRKSGMEVSSGGASNSLPHAKDGLTFQVAPSSKEAASTQATLHAVAALLPDGSVLRSALGKLQAPADSLLKMGCVTHELLSKRNRIGYYMNAVCAMCCATAWVVPDGMNRLMSLLAVIVVSSTLLQSSPVGRVMKALVGFALTPSPKGVRGGGAKTLIRSAMESLKRGFKDEFK